MHHLSALRIRRDEGKSPIQEARPRSRGGDDVYREERRVRESDTDRYVSSEFKMHYDITLRVNAFVFLFRRGSRHRSHRRDEDFYER